MATSYIGVGNFSNAPTSCITASPPENVSIAAINVPFGFTDRWSVWGALGSGAGLGTISANLYTGLNGTGSILASATLKLNASTPYVTADGFYQTIVPFAGIAKSVVIATGNGSPFANKLFFDHMEFGIPPALPEAPALSFSWTPITSAIQTTRATATDGIKYGIDFEDVIAGPDAAPGTYSETSVGSFYSSAYAGIEFINAAAVRSIATGGTAQFDIRTLTSPTGQILSLGKTAVKVSSGETRIIINVALSVAKSAFSFYYASASPVIVRYFSSPNATDVTYLQQTLPATGTCSLPDVNNVYCQWEACRFEFDSAYQSVTISSADPNALFDNVTVGYPIPISGLLQTIENTPLQYYNGGDDSLGTFGYTVPAGPPYPHTYGVTFPTASGWYRSYLAGGPELGPDNYYVPGDSTFVSNYGWSVLKASSGSSPAYINVTDGFIERVSMFLRSGTLTGIWTGPNGTGQEILSTNAITRTTRSSGGYTELTFPGWAHSLSFTSEAVIDDLKLGPHTTTEILPYFPAVNIIVSSSNTNLYSGDNRQTASYLTLTVNPDGTIWRGIGSTNTTPDHWIRDVPVYDKTGVCFQFSFDDAADSQLDFVNDGKVGGSYKSNGTAVKAATGISKWGTSSLHVSPSADENLFEVLWPDLLTIGSLAFSDLFGALSFPVSGTIEAWIRPEYGTSIPFGKTVLMYWAYGAHYRGAEWNSPEANPDIGAPAAVYLYGYASTTPGQVVLECCHGLRSIGKVTVSASTFHHVAITVTQTLTGACSFFVDGTRIASGPSITLAIGSYTKSEARVVIGQADRLGTMEYYVNDFRLTRGAAPLYSGATYTVPTGPFLPQPHVSMVGSGLYVRGYMDVGLNGETVDPTLIPTSWRSEALNTWMSLDVPREFSLFTQRDIQANFKLELASDALGTAKVAIAHDHGAKTLSAYGKQLAYSGASSLEYATSEFWTNGSLESFYALTSTNVERNKLANRLKSASGWRTETFESFTLGSTLPLTARFVDGASALTCEISGAISADGQIVNSSATGQANTTLGGSQWLSISAPVLLSFSSPISVLGLSVTDAGDSGSFPKLVLTDVLGNVTELVFPVTPRPSGSKHFIGFAHLGGKYVSVRVDMSRFIGSIGIDDLLVATRINSAQELLTYEDAFTGTTGLLRDSVPTRGNYWVDALGTGALDNIEIDSLGRASVKSAARGATRYGAVMGNPGSSDVTLVLNLSALAQQLGTEMGLIGRKVGSSYYHLTYKFYPANTLTRSRSYNYFTPMVVVTLTHQPSGQVLLGPVEYEYNNSLMLKWTMRGNCHSIYYDDSTGYEGATLPGAVTNTALATVYDNQILTGGQHGFSIIQPT